MLNLIKILYFAYILTISDYNGSNSGTTGFQQNDIVHLTSKYYSILTDLNLESIV